MPLVKEDPKLLNFFIFNSKFGQKEGQEHEKLMYYYPKHESIDSQVRNVGLAEAITRFSSTFNKKEDCDSLHTQKTHQIYYQPEENIWMIMTVAVGWVQRERDANPVREYYSEGVQDQVLKAHLMNAYKSFKLRHHTFASLLEKKEVSTVKEILTDFFDEYLNTNDMVKGNILTLWYGVSFLPLDKQSFLRVHCVLSLLQTTFPSIVHTAFMYKNNFAWCGFSLEDFQPLSQYLITRLSHQIQVEQTSSLHSSMSLSGSSGNSNSRLYSNSYSRFLGEGPTPSVIVYLQDRMKRTRPHQLVIYVLAGAAVCMSFPAEEKFSGVMFEKLGRLLESRISQLASDIGEQLNHPTENYRYLYHNHMNLATKSSIHGVNDLPMETMQTIVDMHTDLVSNKSLELVVKTSLDHWVVGRSGNGRESYIVVSHKNANLVEISEEVKRMCESQFSSIFMVE